MSLLTRYVSVLDVTPLKPDAASLGSSLNWDPDVEEEGSLIPYARGGPALAQMLRQLVPPEKTICATGLQSFKAPVQNGLKQFATGHANGIGGKGEEVKSNEGTGKKGAGWNGSAKVVDAGASKGGKGKGSAKGGGGELGQKKGGRGKKRVKEEEEIGGQGGVVKLEDLTEEEQLAQAIAASLAEEIVDSKGSSNGKRRKKGVKEEGGLAKEESAAERRRKGDAELEMQLQVAMAATAIEAAIKLPSTPETPSALVRLAKGEAPLRGLKKVSDGKGFGADAGAVWSRRRGPSLHWAEVYCGGGKEGGRWVHVDPVRGVVDAPGGVEAAAAGGKQPLRYVLAFAGGGAKDITRR